ncbi:MAG: 4-hydroxy-3-methylbut-2-enyl diphosphate reductase [Bacteroidales bacterium]|nr:4-hydroxy-3-methylbut-2-enyl diphosphate reductase [Bacteroidales bacterium]
MLIRIDDNAGFCFGVVKAIGTAEAELSREGTLYCLGDIVHNNAEVQRLARQGLQVIEHRQLPSLAGKRVLIRAHGEPPSTYQMAQDLGIRLVDATCPIVLALQQRIRKGYEEMQQRRPVGQIVIFGKPGHAEVIGLCGQTDNTAVVASHPDDLAAVDFTRPIRLYSQTTKSKEEYAQLTANIRRRIEALGHPVPEDHFVAFDTICSRVANRAVELEAFARSVDVVVFVSGKGSSNGHYLYLYCRQVQPNTYLVSNADELQARWFEGVQSVGITGATSTPRWLMEAVGKAISNL